MTTLAALLRQPSTADIARLYGSNRDDAEALGMLPGDAEGFHPLLPQMTAAQQGLSPEQYQGAVQGNGVGVFGKLMGWLGLDAEGHRAAQPWGNALMQTAGTLIDPVGTAGHFVGGVDQSFQDLDRLLQHPSHDPEWGREIARPAFDITSAVAMGGIGPKAGAYAADLPALQRSLASLEARGGSEMALRNARSLVAEAEAAARGEFVPQSGTAGTFGGRLAKTADHAQLARAEEMAGRGVPREQIWNDTGWFQGADKEWLHDIPGSADVNLPVRNGRLVGAESTLGGGGIIRHEGMLDAYPNLSDMPVKASSKDWSHYWPGESNSITIGEARYRPEWQTGVADGNEVLGSPSGYYTLRKTAEHELDHAAYEAEGGQFYNGLGPAVQRSWPEVRARAAEKRADLTTDERRARPPWLDYDVPESDQIVRFGNGPNALFSNSRDAGIPGGLVQSAQDRVSAALASGDVRALNRAVADLRGATAQEQKGGMVAWHASPHELTEFDLSKLGSGEGANVYGQGFYSAESPAVSGPGGHYFNKFADRNGQAHAYQVHINADPEHMLDWDKPLSGQSQFVQNALHPARDDMLARIASENSQLESLSRSFGGDGAVQPITLDSYTGKDIYGSVPGRSSGLSELGIKGVRYLDEVSRDAGQGTSNYVTFNPSDMSVLKRYDNALFSNSKEASIPGAIVNFPSRSIPEGYRKQTPRDLETPLMDAMTNGVKSHWDVDAAASGIRNRLDGYGYDLYPDALWDEKPTPDQYARGMLNFNRAQTELNKMGIERPYRGAGEFNVAIGPEHNINSPLLWTDGGDKMINVHPDTQPSVIARYLRDNNLYANSKEASAPGIVAYHGSPHDFDRFDMLKIGTGEGAQAFGHGLYFADSEGVAKSYKNKLSAPPGQFNWMSTRNPKQYRFEALPGDGIPKFHDDTTIRDFLSNPQYLKEVHAASKFGLDLARNAVASLERERDAALASVPDRYKATTAEDYGRRIENRKKELDREEGAAAELDSFVRDGMKLKQGTMYQVRINADPEHFLDWDKPLSQQSEAVRNALQQSTSPQGLAHALPSDAKALGSGSQGNAFGDQSNSLINRPLGGVVSEGMPPMVDNGQVLNPVVGLDPVKMMNVFGGQEFSPKMGGHDPSMLLSQLPINGRDAIPLNVGGSGSPVGGIAGAAAERLGSNLDVVGMPSELRAALGAGEVNHSRPIGDWLPRGNDTSEWLKTQGIKGTKYLDQGSRAAGEGSRNYVVFDDSLISILKKYGIVGTAAAGGGMMYEPGDAEKIERLTGAGVGGLMPAR